MTDRADVRASVCQLVGSNDVPGASVLLERDYPFRQQAAAWYRASFSASKSQPIRGLEGYAERQRIERESS
jgi:hypothetical protein